MVGNKFEIYVSSIFATNEYQSYYYYLVLLQSNIIIVKQVDAIVMAICALHNYLTQKSGNY